jgi:putative hemolysin
MLILGIGLGLAILMSALFSAAELAVFLPNESRIRSLAEQNVGGAAALLKLREKPERTLVLLRAADALSDVSAGALVAYIAFQNWELLGLALGIGGATFLVLYLGELIPMGIAANRGVGLALAIAPALLVVTRLLSPLLLVLARLARVRPEQRDAVSAITEKEIRQLATLGHTEGEIEEHERELIERAFRLDETKTWEIMTPRVDIFAWPDDKRLARDIVHELAPSATRACRSTASPSTTSWACSTCATRIRRWSAASATCQLRELAREPLVVPGSLPLSRLLRDFQARRIHLGIVIDEYGGTDGLVTLEDVLEELVGEIVDETDVPERQSTRISRNEILAWGDADLREINHFFNSCAAAAGAPLAERLPAGRAGYVPEPGEADSSGRGILIEIMDATETQVTRAAAAPHGQPMALPAGRPPAAPCPRSRRSGATAA